MELVVKVPLLLLALAAPEPELISLAVVLLAQPELVQPLGGKVESSKPSEIDDDTAKLLEVLTSNLYPVAPVTASQLAVNPSTKTLEAAFATGPGRTGVTLFDVALAALAPAALFALTVKV